MIVVDSSALIAIAKDEPASASMRAVFLVSGPFAMSPINWLETRMVATCLPNEREFVVFLATLRLEIVPTDAAQARIAWDAFQRFGKGRHAAALNLADCFAHALAQVSEAPLLYIGTNFAKTDVQSALGV